jgi:1,4-alpha-glucan branching enzyme
VHLGSWKKQVEEDRFMSYFELADDLVNYVKEMNFTHVELMPIMEFPYDPSWGYQVTGYFAPTSRYGYPEEFKYLVDKLHQNDIGIILDWVPSHFPEDAHGLGFFDGSHLYEHPDKRKGYHQDWKSLIFNYERNEVRSFLISNAIFWLDQYHADGIRVDAVASMLFLDYSREDGEWEPNIYGGRENLAVIDFLKQLNQEVYASFPDVQTIAEESTAFPMVSKPTFVGGLGFGMKWMMGWMHDTLEYFAKDPIYRKYHHNDITFANLRLLYGCMFTHPGTKLLFMGGEFGQYNEWDFQGSLDWNLLEFLPHQHTQNYVKQLNALYKTTPALYEKGFSHEGFEWISYDDTENCVMSYIRRGYKDDEQVVVVCNLTPAVRKSYKIGVPVKGKLKEIFNSDAEDFGGSGVGNKRQISIKKEPWNGKDYSAKITLPPLAVTIFKINN